MAKTYYVDVTETDNIDCALDGMVELVSADANIVCVSVTAGSTTVFTDTAGVYEIAATNLGGNAFSAGSKIIIRGSVDASLVDNDGCYTVVNPNVSATKISVKEKVIAATSVSATVKFDEFATFILHPTKRTGQMLIYICTAATVNEFDVSFEPGGYWASKIETVCPVYQGEGKPADVAKMWLLQIETAPYLQTKEEALAVDAVTDVDKKGTILMRVFPGVAGDPLLAAEFEVAYIMIA